MLGALDYAVIAIYFVFVITFGIRAGGRSNNKEDYFLGGKNIPWWVICFSIVATETSTLTVIGVPAIAYGGNLTFFQITLGYLAGRILVSIIFLPRYAAKSLTTTYGFLGERFGKFSQGISSITFLITRLLADGVRLFATAIPIKVILDAAGYDVSYFAIITSIGVLTIVYTYIGGLKAVVWMDFVQLIVYVVGAVIAIFVLSQHIHADWWQTLGEVSKNKVFDIIPGRSFNEIITTPYAFITATIGGAIFTMASHGTDHLIVQRLLACRTVKDSKKALVFSGVLVMAQFALFLLLGLLLWVYYNGAGVAELGLTRSDEVFPKFIIEGLPSGISGFILAGIIAAAMSTLSSSLNALASSTLGDLFNQNNSQEDEKGGLRKARMFTLIWGLVFILFASLFQEQQNPVVELGLAIATFTYGALLGIFLLGLINHKINDKGASLSLLITVLVMSIVILGVKYSETNGWIFSLNASENSELLESTKSIAWPLYTLLGALFSLFSGWILSQFKLFRRTDLIQ